ncbi:MAG: VacB/RNase II family 3'-5' exoribonuclease [Oscillospiraceae bacterium]|nr:VacB/RNase II family 3'-5' exoribonuclease [Oscillospiraceae bacterium]
MKKLNKKSAKKSLNRKTANKAQRLKKRRGGASKSRNSGAAACFEAVVTRGGGTFGFIKPIGGSPSATGGSPELFVRRRNLLGAVTGDIVLARIIPGVQDKNGQENRTAEVVKLLRPSENPMFGVIVIPPETSELFLLPDGFFASPLRIGSWGKNKIAPGDKVKFKISKRGERYSDHVVDIICVYGDSQLARVSVEAYLEEKQIPTVFVQAVKDEATQVMKRGINPGEIEERLDLRGQRIFTIDGSDTKDIDDAISIEKTEHGYRLGVHIADVSYYVKQGSELDKEALKRGNSVYIADMVLPMLPKELSNGICSLNPCEDRLALSCLMNISNAGELLEFDFKKTVIKSLLQGVYSEINSIIEKKESPDITKKYKEIMQDIEHATTLAATLKAKRESRGAPSLNTIESKIICAPDGRCVEIKNREMSTAENIIEEFMLMANTAAARLAGENVLPFAYRVHEPPTAEKLEVLSESLVYLGVDNLGINAKSKAAHLAALLKRQEGSEKAEIVNTLVLRTMMKARYSEEPLGHFGLATDEYAHFTSPIRRYPDLFIHRVISAHIAGEPKAQIVKKYAKISGAVCAKSSAAELVAIAAERDCAKFYMAEYMSDKKSQEFEGIVSGVIANGFFVRLANTVEGRVDISTLPPDDYTVEHSLALKGKNSCYTIGDKITVKCSNVNIPAGMIDFLTGEPPVADRESLSLICNKSRAGEPELF